MKIYTIAMAAHRSGVASVIPGATSQARNKHEAVGIGVEMCKREFPPSYGWRGHEAVVEDITIWLEKNGVVIPTGRSE